MPTLLDLRNSDLTRVKFKRGKEYNVNGTVIKMPYSIEVIVNGPEGYGWYAKKPRSEATPKLDGSQGTVKHCSMKLNDNFVIGTVIDFPWAQKRSAPIEMFKKPADVKYVYDREVSYWNNVLHMSASQVATYTTSKLEQRFRFFRPFVTGVELFDYIADCQIQTLAKANEIISEIAIAIFNIHKEGYIHKDIKPENIIFCETNAPGKKVTIIDGAFHQHERESDKKSNGTPQYAALEIFDNMNKISRASDIYSFGMVITLILNS